MWTPVKAWHKRQATKRLRAEIERTSQGKWHHIYYRGERDTRPQPALLRVSDVKRSLKWNKVEVKNALGKSYDPPEYKVETLEDEKHRLLAAISEGPKRFTKPASPKANPIFDRYRHYRFPKSPIRVTKSIRFGSLYQPNIRIYWDHLAWREWKDDYKLLRNDPRLIYRGLQITLQERRHKRQRVFDSAIFR